MEEGQTVEIQETREPLREQGSIRVLLELLEQQGMNQEKGDVLRMADYIDSMEMQLGTVLKELGEVKKQLGVMQESKVKLFAVNTIQKAEHQVKTLRFQVGEWKRKFGRVVFPHTTSLYRHEIPHDFYIGRLSGAYR